MISTWNMSILVFDSCIFNLVFKNEFFALSFISLKRDFFRPNEMRLWGIFIMCTRRQKQIKLAHLAVVRVQNRSLKESEAITRTNPSIAAAIVRNTLIDWADIPSGKVKGAKIAKYLEAKADRFLILSQKKRKNEVMIIVISLRARTKR